MSEHDHYETGPEECDLNPWPWSVKVGVFAKFQNGILRYHRYHRLRGFFGLPIGVDSATGKPCYGTRYWQRGLPRIRRLEDFND